MTKERKLYELINSLEVDCLTGIGVHESSATDFDTEGFKIYHVDGYCFEVRREPFTDDEEHLICETVEDGWIYSYHEGHFDGFKPLEIDQAITIIEKEGVFV